MGRLPDYAPRNSATEVFSVTIGSLDERRIGRQLLSTIMSAKSKSNATHEAKRLLLPHATVERLSTKRPKKTVDAARPLQPKKTQGQHIEQMYQLADIFAAIFEALPEEYEDAIATRPEAA